MRSDQGSYMPSVGIEPITQVCALTGNQTLNLLVTGQRSNQLSHTGQGYCLISYVSFQNLKKFKYRHFI